MDNKAWCSIPIGLKPPTTNAFGVKTPNPKINWTTDKS